MTVLCRRPASVRIPALLLLSVVFASAPVKDTNAGAPPFKAPGQSDSVWLDTSRDVLLCEPFPKSQKYKIVRDGESIGFSFTATQSRIHRIEVELHNRDTSKFADVSLRKWSPNWRAMRKSSPLFEERIALGIGGAWNRYSVRPRIPTTLGARYYVDVKAVNADGYSLRLADQREQGLRPVCSPPAPSTAPDQKSKKKKPQTPWFRIYSDRKTTNATQAVTSSLDQPAIAIHAEGSPPNTNRSTKNPSPTRWIDPIRRKAPKDENLWIRQRIEAYADEQLSRPQNLHPKKASHLALLEAFRYRASCKSGSCNERFAASASELLLQASAWITCDPRKFPSPAKSRRKKCGTVKGPHSFAAIPDPALAYDWIRRAPSITEATHQAVQEMLFAQAETTWKVRIRGSSNQATFSAAGFGLLAKLFPTHPHAPEWKTYARTVYSDVADKMDTEEDSAYYLTESWLPGLLLLSESLGRKKELWSSPDFVQLVDRTAELVSPLGIVGGFGDGAGAAYDSPGLVWLFREAAMQLGDQRYKRTASRILVYNAQRAIDDQPKTDSWDRFLDYLAHAWLVPEQISSANSPDPNGSVILDRHAIRLRPRKERGVPPRIADFLEARIPDKLVLRSGAGPADLYALFNLTAGYTHGHPEIGALALLTAKHSILATGTGYPYARHEPHVENENTSIVKRITGGTPSEPGGVATIERFDEAAEITVAWIAWNDAYGSNVQQHRHIYFLKNHAIWIRDRFVVPKDMTASVATLWHAARIDQNRGANWVNISTPAPYRNVFRHRNPEQYALLMMNVSGDDGAVTTQSIDVEPRSDFGPLRSCPLEKIGSSPIPGSCRESPSLRVSMSRRITPNSKAPIIIDTVIIPTPAPATPVADSDAVEASVDFSAEGEARLTLRTGDGSWEISEKGLQGVPHSNDDGVTKPWRLRTLSRSASPSKSVSVGHDRR